MRRSTQVVLILGAVLLVAIVVAEMLKLRGERDELLRAMMRPVVPSIAERQGAGDPVQSRVTVRTEGDLFRGTSRNTAGGTHVRTEHFEASAVDSVVTDRSRVSLRILAYGETPPAAAARLGEIRAEVLAAVAAAGLEPVAVSSYDLEIGPAPRRGGIPAADSAGAYAASQRTGMMFDSRVDFVELFAQPELAGVEEIGRALYWFGDLEARLRPLEDRAIAAARVKADRVFGEGGYRVVDIETRHNLGEPGKRFGADVLRVAVTAKIRIEHVEDGTGRAARPAGVVRSGTGPLFGGGERPPVSPVGD